MPDARSDTRRRAAPWAVWLAACVLVLGQAMLFAHEVHHLVEGEDEPCPLCLAAPGAALTPAGLPPLPAVLAAPPRRPLPIRQLVLAQPFRPQSARAPPTLI